MCSGPVSSEITSALASRIDTSLRSPLLSADTGLCRVRCMITASVASSRGDRPPTSTGCSPYRPLSASGELAPSLGDPILLRATRANHERHDRPLELLHEFALPLALVVPRPELPLDNARVHAERRDEFEILILNVLRLVRRDVLVREEPVQHRVRARDRSRA